MVRLESALTAPALKPVVTYNGQALYSLQAKQLECFKLTPLFLGQAGYEHIGYGGAAGGGKSFLARAVAVAAAGMWRGSTGIIFRRIDREVKRNHYEKFLTELPRHIIHEGQKVPFYRWNGEEMAFTFPLWHSKGVDGEPGGPSKIILGHCKLEEDIFKYQGDEFDYIIFEEATHYTWKQVSWLVGNRLRVSVRGAQWKPFVLYPSNPGNVGHQWYKRLFIERNFRDKERPEQYTFLQAFLSDNAEMQFRDPGYEERLNRMDEPWRSWVKDGNWSAGAGMALPQLNRRVHLITPFEVPAHWLRFGSFDWGYQHPFSFGEYAVDEDGNVFKLQTVTGRHLQPQDIARRILARVDVSRLRYIVAGHDCWNERKAEGNNTPSIEEQFRAFGIHLMKANIDRIQGASNLRDYLAWEFTGPLVDGQPTSDDPGLRFFRNDSNLRCIEQLEAMVADPDDMEDVLKVDADEVGEGGDDIYDETRYACASRPRKTPSLFTRGAVSAFSKESLAADVERLYKREDARPKLPGRTSLPPLHPEFGDVF